MSMSRPAISATAPSGGCSGVAVSEDGRLHGEKYFHTVGEEYRTTRPKFRWRQMVALARVTASAYGCNREDQHGFRAAGYVDACKLLGVEA